MRYYIRVNDVQDFPQFQIFLILIILFPQKFSSIFHDVRSKKLDRRWMVIGTYFNQNVWVEGLTLCHILVFLFLKELIIKRAPPLNFHFSAFNFQVVLASRSMEPHACPMLMHMHMHMPMHILCFDLRHFSPPYSIYRCELDCNSVRVVAYLH